MKYALLIYVKPGSLDGLSDEERETLSAEYAQVGQDPRVIGGEQLMPIETATTVRTDDGQTLTTDGPFADTKEILGGFYLLEAEDLDKATASPRAFLQRGWAAPSKSARSSDRPLIEKVFRDEWAAFWPS